MTEILTFEVLSLKGGKWETESILNNKEEAISLGQEVLGQRHFSSVKVIEERYDDETGESKHHLIFNKKKTLGRKKSQYTGPERRQGREWRDNPKAYRKKAMKWQRRKASFIGEVIKLTLGLGAILMALIFFAIIYISE